MLNENLKKPFFFSLLSHAALFGIFSFSLGYKLPNFGTTRVFFLGSFLNNNEIAIPLNKTTSVPLHNKNIPAKISLPQNNSNVSYSYGYTKPVADISLVQGKIPFYPQKEPWKFTQARTESSIMFYPQIPYNFLLYFKDRQVANIEIMFNLNSTNGINAVDIKRKISSGNLEADLLSMRYISHYLFIQQSRFPLNKWQTVKIELRAKDGSD